MCLQITLAHSPSAVQGPTYTATATLTSPSTHMHTCLQDKLLKAVAGVEGQ